MPEIPTHPHELAPFPPRQLFAVVIRCLKFVGVKVSLSSDIESLVDTRLITDLSNPQNVWTVSCSGSLTFGKQADTQLRHRERMELL